ncbi:MAG: DUF2851 family protein [Sphingobacteriaceae bacterium]|nr:DUF2851 family protein [Sphingobacteriaceae bacterium]
MREIDEEKLQNIWELGLLKPGTYYSVNNKEIRILNPGVRNKDSGPDFFNAKIQVDGITLVGNIEIHVNSKDWLYHGHDDDPSYDKLILHVVYHCNGEIQQNTQNQVEVLEIKKYLPDIAQNTNQNRGLACRNFQPNISETESKIFLNELLSTRFEEKLKETNRIFLRTGKNTAETFYILLVKNFGCRINDLPFEMIADILPLKLMLRYRTDFVKIKSLLFGVAGLLPNMKDEKERKILEKEFFHLKHKHQLNSLQPGILKTARFRPGNSPLIKLHQLAVLIHLQEELFFNPQNLNSIEKITACLGTQELKLSKDFIENLIINSIIPFLYFKFSTGNKDLTYDQLIQLIKSCRFEQNHKTKFFTFLSGQSAADSQAMLFLYDHLCSKKKCMQCKIGNSILKEETIVYH